MVFGSTLLIIQSGRLAPDCRLMHYKKVLSSVIVIDSTVPLYLILKQHD